MYYVYIDVSTKEAAQELRDRLYNSDILGSTEKKNLGFCSGEARA